MADEMFIGNTIGSRIRMLRKENDYTLERVSRAIGISRQTMSRYETGVITAIPYDNIVKLAQFYDVDAGYLMGWTNRRGERIQSQWSGSEDYELEYERQMDAVRRSKIRQLNKIVKDLTDDELDRILRMIQLMLGRE